MSPSQSRTPLAFLIVGFAITTTWFAAQAALAETITGTFLDRPDNSAVRLVTYNVYWDSIFDRVNPARAAGFARVATALNPDIWAFQELGSITQTPSSTSGELKTLLDAAQPTAGGWQIWKAGSLAIASRWSLSLQVSNISPAGERPVMAALVDLPDQAFATDLYIINSHYRCCGGSAHDPARQQNSDAIVNWIAQAKTPGGSVELPLNTAITVLGDFNLVGGPQPLNTLVTGDIQDTTRYGPDHPPDWDGTANTVLDARHNGLPAGALWTWRNDGSLFQPGRLDFITYTDSVLRPTHSFVLNTASMAEADLAATGLQAFDALLAGGSGTYDHLPVVMDFVSVPEPSVFLFAALACVMFAGLRRQVIDGWVLGSGQNSPLK